MTGRHDIGGSGWQPDEGWKRRLAPPGKDPILITNPHATGVWISAGSASVVRWTADLTTRLRIDSSVPGRHRSTGRAPTESQAAAQGHHDEHLRSFFAEVANLLPAGDDLLLLGDGEVVGHFAERIRADDRSQGRERRIEVQRSDPLTAAQLRARTRAFAGSPPRRRLSA
jgi:hypothetical protein